VRTAGLKVITTLDWDLQQLAEKVVTDGAAKNEKNFEGTNAALVAQDTKTGQILALVGSRNYFDEKIDGQFNVPIQGLRQPGSAIKPFAYLSAFIKGYTPDTIIFDVETDFNAGSNPAQSYKPQNFNEQFQGPMTMRNSLAQSINVNAVKTLYLAGLDDTLKNARKMGLITLTDPNRYGLSLALGGGEIKLIDLIGAYAVFAQDGVKHKQSFILKIEDNQGKIIEEYKNEEEQVIEPQYIRLINDILTDTEARAPLFERSLGLTIIPNYEVAVKTGTTDDYRDAWTIGYTPSIVAGIWAGNNDNKVLQKRAGSILAALPMWRNFMVEAVKKYPSETFPRPDPILVDKPILKGEYLINNEIHDTLYYISKNDPQGPTPVDPQADSQFENWEKSVREWSINNLASILSTLKNFNITPTAPSHGIEIISPLNAQYYNNPVPINARIKSDKDLIKIEVLFNDRLLDQKLINIKKDYNYNMSFILPLELQNKITFKAVDVTNNSLSKEVIFYYDKK